MSMESFRQFIDKVHSDTALRQELSKASSPFGMPVEALVAFGAAKGFAFSADDASGPVPGNPEGELSEASLDAVSGGGGPPEPERPNPLSIYRNVSGNLMYKF